MRRIIGGLLLRGLRSRKADTGRQILYVTVCWHKKDLEEVHEKMLDLLLPVPLATAPPTPAAASFMPERSSQRCPPPGSGSFLPQKVLRCPACRPPGTSSQQRSQPRPP